MANMNKVILIGRLTRDVETRAFQSGGMVASFGFAVTNRRKNGQTGQWEDEPMFIDCDAFNRGESGKLADMIRDRCRKGSQIMIEGKLHLEQWNDKATGAKRSKHKLVVDNVQFLDPREGGPGGMGGAAGDAMGGGNDDMEQQAPPPPRKATPSSGGAAGGVSSSGGGNNNRGPGRPGGFSPPPAQHDEPDEGGGDIPF